MSAAERHTAAHCTGREGAAGGLTVQPGEGSLAAQQQRQPRLSMQPELRHRYFQRVSICVFSKALGIKNLHQTGFTMLLQKWLEM